MDPITGAILAGTALVNLFGAKKQADASAEAAKIQAQSADKAMGLQRDMYLTTRGDLSPWTMAGAGGLSLLSSKLGVTPQAMGGDAYAPQSPNRTAVQRQPGLMSMSALTVQAPNGRTYNFSTPEQAMQFRQRAGLV